MKVKLLSHVQLFTTPWTAAYHAPLSMGFSRQEYWSGLPLPSLLESNVLCKLCIFSIWGGVIRFIKGALCAGHLLEEGTPLEGGLGSIGSILQVKKLGFRNTKNLSEVTVSM